MIRPLPTRASVSRAVLGCAMMAVAAMLMIDPAFAQAVGGYGNFTCSNGQASGQLYISAESCPTVLKFSNIFSFLICNMEQLSANLLGSMYCGMVGALAPAYFACVTLAVMFQGINFTFGLNPRMSARDLQLFLVKVAVITAFVTNADYLIGIGYKFFVTGMRDGAALALSRFYPVDASGPVSGTELYAYLDKFTARAIDMAVGPLSATQKDDLCKNAIFAVVAIMAVAFPMIFFLALLLMGRVAMAFLRAVFGYVYAIVGIAFLLTLAPFFLSFALFGQTKQFFEKWVGYMVSFSLQVVLLFAFLTFTISIGVNAKDKATSVASIVVRADDPKETTSFRLPWKYCTLCDFKVVNVETGAEINPGKDGNYKDFLGKGTLQCKDPVKPIKLLSAATPGGGKAVAEQQKKITSALLHFGAASLVSLVVLAYIVETLLQLIPSFAQSLAGGFGGATYAAQIGGGYSPFRRPSMTLPFENIGSQMVDNFEYGFVKNTRGLTGNSIGGTYQGFKDSLTGLVTGRLSDGKTTADVSARESGSKERGGLPGAFRDWLSDPNRLGE